VVSPSRALPRCQGNDDSAHVKYIGQPAATRGGRENLLDSHGQYLSSTEAWCHSSFACRAGRRSDRARSPPTSATTPN